MRRETISFIVLLTVLLLTLASYADEFKLNIIYTGSLEGQLEPCGCSPKSDFGGIARIAAYLDAHREDLSPYVLIDAGNFSGKETPQGRLKTATVLKFLGLMKYDAVGCPEREAGSRDGFFDSRLNEYNVPFVCGRSGHGPSVTFMRGNLNVNVSGDTEGTREGKLNILLADLPISGAKSLKGWDIIITSSGEENENPFITDGTFITAGYPKGKKIGILTLTLDENGGRHYTHTWRDIGNDLQITGTAREILDDYDSKVASLLKESEKPAGITYAGVDECTGCHQIFAEKWKDTRHAAAFLSLEEAGKSADPECIACHVVGFGEPGGFYTIETTPGLANVQCESCHGLNRDHLTDYSPMSRVTELTCLKCHTKENSPEFDYPVYLEKIRH